MIKKGELSKYIESTFDIIKEDEYMNLNQVHKLFLSSIFLLLLVLLIPYPVLAAEGNLTAEQWFKKGYDYNEQKEYDNTIDAYTKAVELNPRYLKAYTNRGNAYFYKGQYDLAIADYHKAIELNPQDPLAYNNRGLAYYYKGQYDLAIADYNKAIQVNPEYDDAYNNRGVSYNNKDQLDLAIADYNKTIELNPQHAAAYDNRGLAHHGKGQYDLAIADYNKSIELNPQYAYAYYGKANTLAVLGKTEEAIKHFKLFLLYATPAEILIERATQRIRELGGTT
jgi:tetratricopeptide (TPR) repeat protein